MTSTLASALTPAPRSPPRARPLRCRSCGADRAAAPVAICEQCLGPLDPVYDPARALPDRATIAARAPSLWRYREWLPFEGDIVHSLDTGFTPLLEAPRLARRLGVARAWVKNDTVSHPSLSFKDRVVAAALNAAAAFGLETVGCASTGNLANAVAAHAARAGLEAWIFVPHELETGKVVGTSVYRPHLVRVRGTYDDVNRLCAQVADRFGWGIVNVNLRSYYGEGSKTQAFEIAEQLGWRLPSAVVAPMAGGSLVTKLHKGFGEFREVGLVTGELPRLYGAQAEGCAPIVRLVERGDDRIVPEIPKTIALSIAIGNPADGVFAARAIRATGGWAQAVTGRVPGSTSNLGAGFDCVGIAIDRWIRVAARREESRAAPVTIERRGALAGLALPPERDLLYQGFRSACRAAGREPPPGLVLEASSDIPIARGLGSSAAAVVAGAAAAPRPLALDLSDDPLAPLCARPGGHPHKVAAAIYGGATLVLRGAAGELACPPLPGHPSLVLAFALPHFGVETERARAALPHVVPHRSAVTAAARSAALVHGLAHADAALLAAGLDDVLHVPYRRSLVRHYDAVVTAARGAGAFGATLSGSGSAIACSTAAARSN